jgi:hypothetical protein
MRRALAAALFQNRRLPSRLAVSIGWVLGAVLLGGCGDRGPQRAVVSGTVSHNGKPVSDGVIRFVPATGTSGPTCVALIRTGVYMADALGGVPAGTSYVQIEAFRDRKVPITLPPNEPIPPGWAKMAAREQYLPKKFGVDSDLEITVPSGGRAITKDFDLRD